MAKRHAHTEEAEINITPMLDIVFIMLIFFIVTTSFTKETGAIIIKPDAEQATIPATVPTMAGMVAVLSGVYFGTWLEHKAQTETEKLEDLLQYY